VVGDFLAATSESIMAASQPAVPPPRMNYVRRLKTLKSPTLAQFIWKEWQSKPKLFHEEPCHLIAGLNK
jgi:hypothetical protein